MADEIVSKLGLDASDVINTLNQLATGFVKYTNALAENAGGAANFNSAQKQFVDLLARIETQAKLTAGAIKELNGGVANSGKALSSAAALQSQNNAASAANSLRGQFDTSGANPAQLTAFSSALQTFQTRAAKAGLDTNTLNQIVANTGQTFSGAAAGVNQAALKVIGLGQAFGQVAPQVNQASNATNNFSFSIGRLFEVFAFQQLLRGVGALTGALTQAVPDAIAFEKQIAAIATISDASDKNLQVLSNRIIGLANEFGKPAAEVAAGFYQVLSNQVGNTDQSIQFFTESLKLARATLGSTGDAVNALSGIQLSYGQSAAQASHNADILFATVDLGRVSLKELGDSLGRLNPLASQLGINTEFVAGAISLATQKGVNFRDAQTQILNLFTASLKPTTDFRKRLDELGFASTEAGIAALGASAFFAKIGEGASTSTELAKLFPNIRGLRGEISLFADDGKKLNEILDDIGQRAGAAQKAFETIQFTNAVNIEGELNRVKNILTAGFGHDALAALAAVNTAFGGLANTIAIAAGTLAGLAVIGTTVVIFNQLAAAVTVAATALSAAATISFGAAAAAIVVGTGGIALALAAAVAGFIALRAAIAESDIVAVTADKFERIRAEVDKNATAQSEAVRATQADEVKAVQANVSVVLGAEAQKQQAFIQASNVARELQKADSTSFDSELNIRLKAFTQFQNSIKTLETNQAQNTLKLQEDQRKTEIGIREAQFQRFNAQFSEQRQASNLQTQFARLQGQANTAFQKGDINVGNDILGILGGIAKQYGEITGKTQLESQFINLSRIATQKKIDLGDQAVAQARALEAANQPILDEARRQVELAQILTKELDKVPAGDTERKAALEQQIIQIAQGIDKLGGRLTLGNLKVGDIRTTDIQNISDALKKATGGISLAFSAQKGFDKLRADTKAAFEAQPLVAKLGFEFDEKGFAESQKKIQDLLKASTTGFQAAQALPGLKDQTKAATEFDIHYPEGCP
jgi:TP901 family phage tail tape measure protein